MTVASNEVFEVGTTARIQMNVTVEGDVVDVDTVILKLKDPLGVVTLPNVVREDLGEYYADTVVATAGQYKYRWETTSPISAEEGSFVVRKSGVL